MLTQLFIEWINAHVVPFLLDNSVLISSLFILGFALLREWAVDGPFWKRQSDDYKLSRKLGIRYFGAPRYRRYYRRGE